jgi:hypothetical protein
MKKQGFYRRVDDLVGIHKAPTEQIDYSLDWSDHLPAGVTITGAVWQIPGGLSGTTENIAGSVVTKRISGGTAGYEYNVDCTITKSNGEVVPRSFVVSVVARLS